MVDQAMPSIRMELSSSDERLFGDHINIKLRGVSEWSWTSSFEGTPVGENVNNLLIN
jgi:hypothetical protein